MGVLRKKLKHTVTQKYFFLGILINVKAGRVKLGARKVYRGRRVGQAWYRVSVVRNHHSTRNNLRSPKPCPRHKPKDKHKIYSLCNEYLHVAYTIHKIYRNLSVRCEVFKAANMKTSVFWDAMPCILEETFRQILKMWAGRSSETWVKHLSEYTAPHRRRQ
jgi:hypothetical protein